MYYYIIMLLLILGTILELNNKKSKTFMYALLIILLTFTLSARYGQGSDYFSYYAQYLSIPTSLSTLLHSINNYHGETGWLLIMYLFKLFNINYTLFISIISILMMYFLAKAINRVSPLKVCSLLLFFPTFYMTYFFSALRQGLVLSIFLSMGIDFLLRKKKLLYFLTVFLMMYIHRSSIILIFLPIIIDKEIEKKELIVFFLSIIFFLIGYIGGINIVSNYVLGISSYLSVTFSLGAVLVRIMYFFIVKQLHYKVKDKNDKVENILYNIYFFGFYIFLSFSFSGTLSQRLTMPMKSIEMLLIPLQINLLYKFTEIRSIEKRKPNILMLNRKSIVILYTVILLFIPGIELHKNIKAYLSQGKYFLTVKPYQYPYVTIWNKNKIYNYIYSINYNIEE